MWLPVEYGINRGWVNSRYLVEEASSEEFCRNEDSRKIVDDLMHGIRLQDGVYISELVAKNRGIRLRRDWWNPEVRLEREMVSDLFSSELFHNWGIADGSGEDISGSFSQVMNPLLDKNLIGATELGCGEILHGGTAGFVRLPTEYNGINFYSMYRPADPDDVELDWGTWVVGIEKWQGDFWLSFLIHYEWEI